MPIAQLFTGVDLYYESHGSGEPLILIPSTAYSAEVWKPSQMPLAETLRLVLHDPRGCGRSVAAQAIYTIEQMAADVAALMEHLQIPAAHVLGHSMGGRIALSLAQNFPGRVKSLILAATGSGPAGRAGSDCIPGLPHRWVLELVEKGFEKFVYEEICESDTFFTKTYRTRFPERVQEFYRRAWATHAKLPEFIRLCIARHNWEGTHRLGDVKAPALVVVGDQDTGGSDHVAQSAVLQQRIPGAELRILHGQSHGFFWQAPEETNAMIREWVERHR
ncbi:MAG TPA: alpha/beta hydrolase [candidate division Zixibacteria bacterium]|nr:alpha/beta hydrolase [candidate division Zixibacteria bacterium]